MSRLIEVLRFTRKGYVTEVTLKTNRKNFDVSVVPFQKARIKNSKAICFITVPKIQYINSDDFGVRVYM